MEVSPPVHSLLAAASAILVAMMVGFFGASSFALPTLMLALPLTVMLIALNRHQIAALLLILAPVLAVVLDGQLGGKLGTTIVLPVVAWYFVCGVVRKNGLLRTPARLWTLLALVNVYHLLLLFSLLLGGNVTEGATYWAGAWIISNGVILASSQSSGMRGAVAFIVGVLAWTGLIFSAIGVLFVFSGPVSVAGVQLGAYTNWTGIPRFSSLFASPIPFGILLVFSIPAVLSKILLYPWGFGKFWWSAALLLMLVNQFFTLSKSAWVGAAVGMAVVCRLHSGKSLRRYLFISVFIGVVGLSGLLISSRLPSFLSMIRGDTGLSGRDVIWSSALGYIGERPFFGYGPGMGNVVELAIPGLSTHSTYLRIMLEGGAIGLCVYAFALLFAGWSLLKRVREATHTPERMALAALLAGFVGFALQQFSETSLFGGTSFYSVMTLLCMGTAVATVEGYHGSDPT